MALQPQTSPLQQRGRGTSARPKTPSAPLSSPVASTGRGSCACGGGCPRCQKKSPVQTKLEVSQPGDALEHEADRVAQQVMRMPSSERVGDAISPGAPRISRYSAGSSPGLADVPDAVQDVLGSSGQPLDANTRGFFEPRFGRDFADVRVHTDGKASASARALRAAAYTVGNNVVFSNGRYAPGTAAGQSLLAHELTHTVQQQGAPPRVQRLPDRSFPDTSGGGSTTFRETVETAPAAQADGTITGRVRRREIAAATDTQAEQTVNDQYVNVIFNPNTCRIEVPYRLNFVPQATAGAAWTCQEPPNATAVPNVDPTRLAEIGQQYVDAMNAGLNGWYSLSIDGCQHNCAGRSIPVVVVASVDSTNPHQTINVVNRGGRADASTICAGSFNPGTVVHEGGHQALGMGDEYHEDDAAVLAAAPEWGREERVRDSDLSQMSSHHSYGRFAMFNERHFRFAQVFLESVLEGSGCNSHMAAESHVVPDVRIGGLIGGAGTSLGGAMAVGGGVDLGIPLTRARELELTLGAHATYLMTPWEFRDALLLGGRLGLLLQMTPSTGVSVGGELFGEAGASLRWGGRADAPLSATPYVEGGAAFEVGTPIMSGTQLMFRVEGALGRELPDEAHAAMTDIVGADREALEWVRVGFALGLRL
jgi:Domain of unknown function (DUF4157)